MKIKRLVVENFKSIERIELIEPNPFTVFVGPNGSGKSNIFEALEFLVPNMDLSEKMGLFGGIQRLRHRQSSDKNNYLFLLETDLFDHQKGGNYIRREEVGKAVLLQVGNIYVDDSSYERDKEGYKIFAKSFSRIFVGNYKLLRRPYIDDSRLALDASNLEPVLKRILHSDVLRAEIFEWLDLFVPGFQTVEVDERNELHWFDKYSSEYFIKDLISDGTYNILAILTAVYQSSEPQFLCIEEPENGLNPKVVKELVNLCRYACEEYGHYIWLNTHSQTLVSALTPEEIILVDKMEGATQTKQIKGTNLYDLPMDEAWLSNALGGGLPW